MPEKVDTGGFPLKHNPFDLTLGGGAPGDVVNNWDFSTHTGPDIPGPDPNPEDPKPPDPMDGQVIYIAGDGFYYYDGAEWLPISMDPGDPGGFLNMVRYNNGVPEFEYWDGSDWIPIASLPAMTVDPDDGETRWNLGSGVLEYWDGSAWQDLGAALPTSDPGGGALWLDGG